MRFFFGRAESRKYDKRAKVTLDSRYVPTPVEFFWLVVPDTRPMGFCAGCYQGVEAQEIPLGRAHIQATR